MKKLITIFMMVFAVAMISCSITDPEETLISDDDINITIITPMTPSDVEYRGEISVEDGADVDIVAVLYHTETAIYGDIADAITAAVDEASAPENTTLVVERTDAVDKDDDSVEVDVYKDIVVTLTLTADDAFVFDNGTSEKEITLTVSVFKSKENLNEATIKGIVNPIIIPKGSVATNDITYPGSFSGTTYKIYFKENQTPALLRDAFVDTYNLKVSLPVNAGKIKTITAVDVAISGELANSNDIRNSATGMNHLSFTVTPTVGDAYTGDPVARVYKLTVND